MKVKEYSNKLNALTKYALKVISTNLGKIEIFIWGLKLDIAKDVVMEIIPLDII